METYGVDLLTPSFVICMSKHHHHQEGAGIDVSAIKLPAKAQRLPDEKQGEPRLPGESKNTRKKLNARNRAAQEKLLENELPIVKEARLALEAQQGIHIYLYIYMKSSLSSLPSSLLSSSSLLSLSSSPSSSLSSP
jgi:hypothetical protein